MSLLSCEPVDLRQAPALAEALLDSGWLRVAGLSMYPALRRGDRVEVDSEREPAPGDVVVVRRAGGLLCHRLVSIGRRGFVTRGDAQETTDGAVPRDALLGVVARLERRGVWRAVPAFEDGAGVRLRRRSRELLARVGGLLRSASRDALVWVASLSPWRRAACALASAWVRVRVLVPVKAGLFLRPLGPRECLVSFPELLRLRASVLGVLAGELEVRHCASGTMIGEARVRPALRGLGIAERLAVEAALLLERAVPS